VGAVLFALFAIAVVRYEEPSAPMDGYWARASFNVLAAPEDAAFVREEIFDWALRLAVSGGGVGSWTRQNLFVLDAVDALPRPSRGIILWSTHTSAHVTKINALTDGGRWGIMPIDDTPIPASLAHAPRLENTYGADIAWQWRVHILGAPADHVDRPAPR
jgi:hypothetical protein